MAIRCKNTSFNSCQNYECMNNCTITSGLEVVPIELFKLRQCHSGFERFEAVIANIVIRIRGGRQENQGMILDRAKTVLFSIASETYLRHIQSRNQRVPDAFTRGLSYGIARLITYLRVFGTVMRWRSCLRHCRTSRKVSGLIPDVVIGIFH